MIKINAAGLGKFAKHLQRDINRQLPYLYKRVLDECAYKVQKDLTKTLSRKVDRPTKFTQRAWNVRKSTKQNLTSTIFLNPIQAGYLKWVIKGGIRRPDKKYIALAVGFKQNSFGNYPAKKRIKQILARPNTFIAEINGINGIWQRKGKGGRSIKLLFSLEKQLNYDKPKMTLRSIHRTVLGSTKKNARKIIGKEISKLIGKSRVFKP